MVVSKYEKINGKCYVTAEDYDNILYSLKNANDIIHELEEKLQTAQRYLIEEMTAMQMAEVLITHKTKCGGVLGTPKWERNTFSLCELREIAGYLNVYCEHNQYRDDD